MESQFVDSNGIRIHVTTDGPSDGEPVLLIHGFPETSYEWRYQIPALVDAGYRVIVPDTRGFGLSDKPRGRYSRAMLAADMVGVLDHFDVEQAAVVGHDWGGIIGFKLVIDYQDRVSRTALMDTLCTVWTPFAIHGFWFKARALPELFYAEYHEQFIETIFTGQSDPALPGPPASPWAVGRQLSPNRWATDEDVRVYKEAFADPDSHAAAISYYRHALPFHRMHADDQVAGGYRCERLNFGPGRRGLAAGIARASLGHRVHGVRPRGPAQALRQAGALDVRPLAPAARRRSQHGGALGQSLLRSVPDVLPRSARSGRAGSGTFLPRGSARLHQSDAAELPRRNGERGLNGTV